MSEWQPISTAPKDGSGILAVLVWKDDGEFYDVQTIRWQDTWGEWVPSAVLIHMENTGDPSDDVTPTHWMPLPEPPRATDSPSAS
jgi:hypothetical protein